MFNCPTTLNWPLKWTQAVKIYFGLRHRRLWNGHTREKKHFGFTDIILGSSSWGKSIFCAHKYYFELKLFTSKTYHVVKFQKSGPPEKSLSDLESIFNCQKSWGGVSELGHKIPVRCTMSNNMTLSNISLDAFPGFFRKMVEHFLWQLMIKCDQVDCSKILDITTCILALKVLCFFLQDWLSFTAHKNTESLLPVTCPYIWRILNITMYIGYSGKIVCVRRQTHLCFLVSYLVLLNCFIN